MLKIHSLLAMCFLLVGRGDVLTPTCRGERASRHGFLVGHVMHIVRNINTNQHSDRTLG